MNTFLFVGNGPYRNRGCEAIVRGTMEILSQTFGEDLSTPSGVMAQPVTVAAQQAAEIDPRVQNFSISQVGKRFSRKWWMAQSNKRLGTDFQHHVLDLHGKSQGARAALQLGGDNYSLDYGLPADRMAIDRYLQKRNIPVFLWGASVGPFDQKPEFASIMFDHLRTLNGIFVRETETLSYLRSNGVVENVHFVADPAFVMKKTAPPPEVQALVTPETIGINISPLVARFAGASGVDEWREKAAAMIIACGQTSKRPILLIPHVASPLPDEDDYAFMASLKEKVGDAAGVSVNIVPPLGAAELKWVIGTCAAFAGARTHATIAAMSSCVPTLSLSYSVKAIGINQDVFDHQDFCVSVKTIDAEQFAAIVHRMIEDGPAIRAHLNARIPEIKQRSLSAGALLKEKTGS